MIAYFTASVTGKKQYLKNYLRILEELESKGIKAISDHIINSTVSLIHSQNKEERLTFHKKLDKWLQSCDFVVAETSFPSISVGFEISLALHYHKPVLLLYSEGMAPSILVDHASEKLVIEKYDYDTLSDIITDFVDFAKNTADSRFTFFITPEIARFLDKTTKKQKLPKSVYLRKLIEEKMEKK